MATLEALLAAVLAAPDDGDARLACSDPALPTPYADRVAPMFGQDRWRSA